MFVVFDVLHRDEFDLTSRPYCERRRELEELQLDSSAWTTSETFDDGRTLFTAVCELGFEGVVIQEPLEPLPVERGSRLGEGQEPERQATRSGARGDVEEGGSGANSHLERSPSDSQPRCRALDDSAGSFVFCRVARGAGTEPQHHEQIDCDPERDRRWKVSQHRGKRASICGRFPSC